jgi:divalent metal cation (Fe/Co/Zn/Cd) transporter
MIEMATAAAVQVFASVQSGSLSIITSALDSFLDLVSGCILFLTARSMRKNNKYKYAPWPDRTHVALLWAVR